MKAIGVVDRSVSFGWNSGALYQEILAVLGQAKLMLPSVSFIGGLGGADITLDHMIEALNIISDLSDSPAAIHPTQWLE